VAKIYKIKEFVIESRCEYVTTENLLEIKEILDKKYVELAIGLETTDDYIRNNYINKGIMFNSFKDVLKRCKEHGIGVKTYLLFKPPFLNEQSAIDDCTNSIRSLLNLKVNSISINPMNVQKNTLVEYLWYKRRYSPPWFYSLFKCLRKSLSDINYNDVRILSNPSGAGTKRGIHNCLKRECENKSKNMLRNFVLTQDLNALEEDEIVCSCKKKYQLQKDYR
jgi:radical SAM enzyme (TIGR01210 family)